MTAHRPGEDPDILQYLRDQINVERLTLYGITLRPRTPAVADACRRFLASRSSRDLFALSEIAGDGGLVEDALRIFKIAKGAARRPQMSITVAPTADPYCDETDGFRCYVDAEVKATVICRTCGQVEASLCMDHFDVLLQLLPESEAYCDDRSPGYHQLVGLVEAHASR